jgi:hypothetical protein
MNKFPWGKVIDRFQYDFDGDAIEVVKYIGTFQGVTETKPSFHIEELHASYNSVQAAIIAYFAYKNLGLNQHVLVSGVCRALEVKE